MLLPIILVNFKCYVTGKEALKLARICKSVSNKFKVNIAVAPQFVDIRIIKKIKIDVFSQHVDPIDFGQFTGHVSALAIKKAGAIGTLINHSEKKLILEDVRKCIELTKKYKLVSVCFASSPEEAESIAKFNPDFIVAEPPELIASGISVSKAKPEIVTQTIDLVKAVNPRINVLCGAGITTSYDVKKAIELGTVGVVVSSGVVKAKYPKKVLTEFASAIK